MHLLSDCVNLLVGAFDYICSISLIPGITVGGLMLGIGSFIVVFRLIILPLFQTGNIGKDK